MGRMDTTRRSAALITVLVMVASCSGGGGDSDGEEQTIESAASVPATEADAPVATEASTDEAPDVSTTSPTPTTEPAPPMTLPRETVTVVSVDPDTGEASEVEVEAPGPTTFGEVVDFGIDAGVWDERDGLTRVLDFIVGASSAEQVPGVEDVVVGEVSEILERAWQLNASGEFEPSELEDLRQRYEMFAPPADVLDQLASSATEVPEVTGFRRAAPPACAPIAVDDFDENAWFEGCYLVVQTTLSDATLRVFYPSWYEEDGNLASLPTVALNALVKSTNTYRSLGAVGNIDFIFSATDTIDNRIDEDSYALATAWGVKPWENSDVTDRCAVTTWPVATLDVSAFEQTVAHEAWHCVQYYDGMEYSGAGDSWWVEGGAEFFSNVVYPSINDEHTRLWLFDEQIEVPLFDMEYEVWPWWQHLSNEFSPLFVADLHREMMATGGSGIELLSGYEETFHDFVVDYVAGTVIDQNGSPIPKAEFYRPIGPTVRKGEAGRELTKSAPAWAPYRYFVSYDKQLRIRQTDASEHGLRSMVEYEQRTDRAAWKGFFPEVRSKCESRKLYAGVITDTTTDASTTVDIKITIDDIEEASCDPCVLGTWSLDLNTFEEMIMGGIASEGGMPPGTSFEIGGAYYVAFDDQDIVRVQRDKLSILASLADVGGFTTTIDSFAEGTYSADGERLTINALVESYNQVTSNLPGGRAESFPGAIDQGTGTYTCDADNLVVTIDSYPPVSFTRVDKILAPPDAPTDPSGAAPED